MNESQWENTWCDLTRHEHAIGTISIKTLYIGESKYEAGGYTFLGAI